MGIPKGKKAYEKFREGGKITRMEAMDAQCYDCMGGALEDCESDLCPLYDYRPNKGRRGSGSLLGDLESTKNRRVVG